jgi:RNA polymerase II subunit A small phosphatase-like protein
MNIDNQVDNRILLILDLDETLIHASPNALDRPADFQLFTHHVYKRPYLEEFLKGCNQFFRLAIWSSASDDYVEEIVKRIIPKEINLEFVWGRTRCTYCTKLSAYDADVYVDYYSHYQYVKILKKVKKRGFVLERVLIVDDTPSKSGRNYGNAIYPAEYAGEPDDQELRFLLTYLIGLWDVENVRAIEKRNWKARLLL